MSLLAYHGIDEREDELAERLRATREEGTPRKRIAAHLRRLGFRVAAREGMTLTDLERHTSAGRPVLALVQAYKETDDPYAGLWSFGHYVLVVGVTARRVYVMDPSTTGRYAFVPRAEWDERWHDTDGNEELHRWGLVATKRGVPAFNPAVAERMP